VLQQYGISTVWYQLDNMEKTKMNRNSHSNARRSSKRAMRRVEQSLAIKQLLTTSFSGPLFLNYSNAEINALRRAEQERLNNPRRQLFIPDSSLLGRTVGEHLDATQRTINVATAQGAMTGGQCWTCRNKIPALKEFGAVAIPTGPGKMPATRIMCMGCVEFYDAGGDWSDGLSKEVAVLELTAQGKKQEEIATKIGSTQEQVSRIKTKALNRMSVGAKREYARYKSIYSGRKAHKAA
jgi:hypothetical protein